MNQNSQFTQPRDNGDKSSSKMTTPNSLGNNNNSGANLFGGNERYTPKNTGQSMAQP